MKSKKKSVKCMLTQIVTGNTWPINIHIKTQATVMMQKSIKLVLLALKIDKSKSFIILVLKKSPSINILTFMMTNIILMITLMLTEIPTMKDIITLIKRETPSKI